MLRVADRTLTVEMIDGVRMYLATWFTEGRELRMQEGTLIDDEKAVRWLLTGDPGIGHEFDIPVWYLHG